MSRSAAIDIQTALLINHLEAAGEDAPPLEDKLQMLSEIRNHSTDASARIDHSLLKTIEKMASGLREADKNQKKLRALIQKLTASPWHPAILLGIQESDSGPSAMVMHGSMRRVVSVCDEIDSASLNVGDEVLLGSSLNVIMARSSYACFSSGQTAMFDRYTENRRLVLNARDEEIVVSPIGELCHMDLQNGDKIRYDNAAWIAYERIEQSKGEHFFLEETPRISFADIGGLDDQIDEIKDELQLHYDHPDTVRKYQLKRIMAILLHGPEGTGKTETAKAIATHMAAMSNSGDPCFISIKPGAMNSKWFGETEANYRQLFRIAQKAGRHDPKKPVVIFFDEVDSIATTRGTSIHRIDDRVLNAFMAELSGLEDRGNILVITATNRLDALDPAMIRPGRLGDLVLPIPRPNRSAARAIFCRHLRPEIPYTSNGQGPAFSRDMLIDAAVSRLYSPNGESELGEITFRDGKKRTIYARDLINGAQIAKIARIAAGRACKRETRDGSTGIKLEDMLAGVDVFFETAMQALTPANCHGYLDDLPQDMDVVRIDRVRRKVQGLQNYMNNPR